MPEATQSYPAIVVANSLETGRHVFSKRVQLREELYELFPAGAGRIMTPTRQEIFTGFL